MTALKATWVEEKSNPNAFMVFVTLFGEELAKILGRHVIYAHMKSILEERRKNER